MQHASSSMRACRWLCIQKVRLRLMCHGGAAANLVGYVDLTAHASLATHARMHARLIISCMHACVCVCVCVDGHIQKQFAGTTSVVCVMQAAASQARVRILWHDSEPLSWYLPTGAYDTTSLLFQHFIHAHTQVHHTCCKA